MYPRVSVFAVLLVLGVIFSSGCVSNQPGIATGNGVNIVEFEPEMRSLGEGEALAFRMKIKNTGSFEASGLSKISAPEWECGHLGGPETFTLIAPSEERGTEGEEKVITWTCTSPQTVAAGLTVPYEIRAEVEYPYTTLVSKSITMLPTREMIALRDAGKTLPSETITKSNSPVDMDIQIEGPIRIREDMGYAEFPVNIKITNTGGGIVLGSTVDLTVNKIEGIDTVTSCDQNDLHLWRGQSQTITCEMKTSQVSALTQGRIEATLSYSYVVSQSTKVDVVGT